MKILIICSKAFYPDIPPVQAKLEQTGHTILLPNSYDNVNAEQQAWDNGTHSQFKKAMFQASKDKIKEVDAVLCLNFEKNGQPDYIGGATFLELYDAFTYGKKIYLYNDIPQGMLYDEIEGFEPILIHRDLTVIKD